MPCAACQDLSHTYVNYALLLRATNGLHFTSWNDDDDDDDDQSTKSQKMVSKFKQIKKKIAHSCLVSGS